MTRKNARDLSAIADRIHKLAGDNIFDVGELLLEARTQCKHGEWLDWYGRSDFEWSVDTAERYIALAEPAAKFRTVRNLKLPARTFYALGRHKNPDEMPSIIEELAQRATGARLSEREARMHIRIGVARHRHGDRPDATLARLMDLEACQNEAWYRTAVDALLKANPASEQEAIAIVNEAIVNEAMCKEAKAASKVAQKKDDEAEAEAILDGAPPELPPPVEPPPQRLDSGTSWAENDQFAEAIDTLHDMRGKAVERLAGRVDIAKLRIVIELLEAVISRQEQPQEADDKERASEGRL